jgi:hypothetical protein
MTQFDWLDFFPAAQSFGDQVNIVMRSLPLCRREAEVGLLHLTPSLDEEAMARQLRSAICGDLTANGRPSR